MSVTAPQAKSFIASFRCEMPSTRLGGQLFTRFARYSLAAMVTRQQIMIFGTRHQSPTPTCVEATDSQALDFVVGTIALAPHRTCAARMISRQIGSFGHSVLIASRVAETQCDVRRCSFNCLLDANIAYDSGRFSGPGHWIISDMLEVHVLACLSFPDLRSLSSSRLSGRQWHVCG